MYKILCLDKDARRTFGILLFLSCLYILPIIIADSYYIDDWGRNVSGYAGWEYLGRPATTWIMKLLSFGYPLFDVSPMPLILAILILCYSLVLFSRQYFINYPSKQVACALFFFIGNPFLLENISFKFDVLSMFIAISSMIILFSFTHKIGNLSFLFLSVFCITVTINTYQPALCAFFCFFVIKLLFDILYNQRIDYKSLYIYILALIISSILYKVTTIKYFISDRNIRDGYAAAHSSLIDCDYWNVFCANFKQFMNNIVILFNTTPSFYIILSFLLVSVFIALVIENYNKIYNSSSLLKRMPILVFILLSPVVIIINSYLLMTILKSPIFLFRTMIAFGCFLMMIGISILIISKYIKFLSLLFIPFLLFMFSISYMYGNVLKNQKKYLEHILQDLSYDLEKEELIYKIRTISFMGKPYDTIQLYNANKRFPIMQHLVPSMLDNHKLTNWGVRITLSHYIQRGFKIAKVEHDDEEFVLLNNPYITNILYDIYLSDNKIIVNFSKAMLAYRKKLISRNEKDQIIERVCLGGISDKTIIDDTIEFYGWILHSKERAVDHTIAIPVESDGKKYIIIEKEKILEFARAVKSEVLNNAGFRATLPVGEYWIGYQLDDVFYKCDNLKID